MNTLPFRKCFKSFVTFVIQHVFEKESVIISVPVNSLWTKYFHKSMILREKGVDIS